MRILFYSHYFTPEGNAPASRVHEMCKRWAKAGHEVRVVTGVPNVPEGVVYEGYKNRLKQNEVVDGIKVTRVWTYIAANKGTILRILNFISYLLSALFWTVFTKKPDVVIATSPQFFCGWAGVLFSKIRRVPFILEIRDIWPESIVAVGAMEQGRLLRFLEWLELKMYTAANHIVAVGEGYKQRLLEKGVSEKKISIVMNGIDQQVFSPRVPDVALIQQHNLEGRFVCSYIGTIGMACGLEVVLRAAKVLKEKCANITFLIVGDGAVRQSLQEQALNEGLDNVIFTGLQPKDRMPNYLSISDACFIHLKKTDLFTTVMPSKVFEAAGMCKPIIMGVAGYAAQIVKEAQAGIIVEPENESDLVQAAEALSNNPELAKQYGQSGYEYVIQHYNRDDLSAKYIEIIQELISCPKSVSLQKSNLSA